MKTFLLLLFAGIISLGISAQPVIQSFSPLVASIGSTITIQGIGFNPKPDSNIVYFGGVRAKVISANSTTLQVLVPTGVSYQPISVTNNGLTSFSKLSFTLIFTAGTPIQTLLSGKQVVLEPSIEFTTDRHPNDITLADFNGDGKPDLATSNNYSVSGMPASLSVLKNTSMVGQISFSARQDLPTGQLAYAIASGDLDGDGKPDLVCTSIVDQTISIFRNTSSIDSIQFSSKVAYASSSEPFSVVIADVDGDGRPDIIVANNLANTLSIYRNRSYAGNLVFDNKIDIPTMLAPSCVIAADFDGDGRTDLAVTNEFSNSVSVLRNASSQGNIVFSYRVDLAVGSHPLGLTAGDIDQDGLVDLLVANNGSNGSLSILRNLSSSGSIQFSSKVDFQCGQNVYSVSLGDLNGDGKVDIVLPGNLLVMYQNNSTPGNLSLGNVVYSSILSGADKTALSDIDGDGKTDLSGCLFSSTSVGVCRNKDNEPSITNFTPNTAGSGGSITISGNNLGAVSNVSFGGTAAASFHIDNALQITAVVGNGSSGNVTLTNPYGSQSLAGFIYTSPPLVASFFPTQAGADSVVVIKGQYLRWTTAVSFGSTMAKAFTIINDSTISAVVANGTSGYVTVTSTYGTDSLIGFSFIQAPTILSFNPQKGGTGTNVMIIGQNFATTHSVTIGDVITSYTVISNDSILAIVGDGGFGNVTVRTLGGISSAGPFIFPKPTISSFSPDSGYAGTYVTINGQNFRSDAEGNTVYFGSAKARVITASNSSLTVEVPPNTTYLPLTVITNGYSVSTPKPFSLTFSHDSSELSSDAFRADNAFKSPGQPWQQLLVDLDGDGKSDLVSVNYQASTIDVLRNTTIAGKTSFGPPDTIAGSYGFNISIRPKAVDIDNDGKVDIIFTCDRLRMTILKNTSTLGKISFAAPISIPINEADDLAAGDFDGDGSKDIAVLTGPYQGSSVYIFKNKSHDGTIQLADPVIVPLILSDCMNITTGDIDGDGKADLVIGDDKISILRNLSDTNNIAFASQIDFPYPNVRAQYLAVGDMDGDGKIDIVSTSGQLHNSYSILRNISTPGLIAFDARKDFDLANYITDVQVGDLNGDNKPDMVISMEKSIGVFTNISDSSNIKFSPPIYYYPGLTYNWTSNLSIGDVDGDGRQDIAVSIGADDRISIFSNHIGDKDVFVCVGADTSFHISSQASSYQWQMDSGNGFYDIAESSNYIGTQTASLKILNIPINTNGNRFRCRAGKTYSSIYSLHIPILSITTNGSTTICNGGSVILNSSIATGNQWFFNGTIINGAKAQSFTAQQQGIYTVAANINNCLVKHDTTIFVLPVFTPSISINYTGCGTNTIAFKADTANCGPGASIAWYVNNNLQSSGNTLSLNNQNSITKVYAKVSVAAICASTQNLTSDTVTINCKITAVPDVNGMEILNVTPNPTNGIVTIILKLNQPENFSFVITDINGKKIREVVPFRKSSQITQQINLSNQPAGIYFLSIGIGHKKITKKILLIK